MLDRVSNAKIVTGNGIDHLHQHASGLREVISMGKVSVVQGLSMQDAFIVAMSYVVH